MWSRRCSSKVTVFSMASCCSHVLFLFLYFLLTNQIYKFINFHLPENSSCVHSSFCIRLQRKWHLVIALIILIMRSSVLFYSPRHGQLILLPINKPHNIATVNPYHKSEQQHEGTKQHYVVNKQTKLGWLVGKYETLNN